MKSTRLQIEEVNEKDTEPSTRISREVFTPFKDTFHNKIFNLFMEPFSNVYTTFSGLSLITYAFLPDNHSLFFLSLCLSLELSFIFHANAMELNRTPEHIIQLSFGLSIKFFSTIFFLFSVSMSWRDCFYLYRSKRSLLTAICLKVYAMSPFACRQIIHLDISISWYKNQVIVINHSIFFLSLSDKFSMNPVTYTVLNSRHITHNGVKIFTLFSI